ncbi:MAG TPA: MFS transporter [Gaiellaceae bacterium]|nr:MFS transporter [Gaiellaceae bacterium]
MTVPASGLRSRPLIALLTAEAISSLGSQMTFLALPWFVLVTTGSAAKMTAVLAAELLPVALLGIPSGAVISRLGARTTMVIGDAARAPLMLAIPVLHEAGLLTFPLLLVCVFAIGVFIAPYFSAQRLILPELVGEDEHTVAQANAVVEGAQRVTALLGPALAGVLIAAIGAAQVLYVDAATFLVSCLILLTLVPRRPPVAETEEAHGLFAGIRFLLADRFLRVLSVTALFLNMFGQMLSASLPVLAYQQFDGSSGLAGLFFASFGAGSLIGVALTVTLAPKFDPAKLGAVAVVALTIPLPLLGLPLPAPAVMAVLFVSSIFGPLVNAPLISVITMRTPEALRPKVMTGLLTTALLAGPVGLLLAGPLLVAWGPRAVLFFVGVGQFVATLPFAFVALRSRTPELQVAPEVA